MRQRLTLVGATLLNGAGAPAQGREALPLLHPAASVQHQPEPQRHSAVQRLCQPEADLLRVSYPDAGNRDLILKAFDLLLLLSLELTVAAFKGV